MKLIRNRSAAAKRSVPSAPQKSIGAATGTPWRVLVVDDDKDIHSLTRLNLRDFQFAGRGIELVTAMNGVEARKIITEQEPFAVALVDVVMEQEDAGLKLVEWIRQEWGDSQIRVIIRTGQPGIAPERYVIDNYDIDDYKDKTELTAGRLYTAMRTAIKAYRDIQVIESNRMGLEQILETTPNLFPRSVDVVPEFFQGVLTQIISLCHLGKNSFVSSAEGLLLTLTGEQVVVQAGTGDYENINGDKAHTVATLCGEVASGKRTPQSLGDDILLIPLMTHKSRMGFIYLENASQLSKGDRHIIHVMANQFAAVLANLQLTLDLQEANKQAMHMLAIAAEFKDTDTGCHIHRIANLVTRVAEELGISRGEAVRMGQASKLHDIGKIGVPDDILRKPEKLTKEEYEVIKAHPGIGATILGGQRWFEMAHDVALFHHEKWNGSGYPQGLAGEAIPIAARIVAVADVFDALTNKRPYKRAWTLEEAMTAIFDGKGSHFDPQVVEVMRQLFDNGFLHENMGCSYDDYVA
uniref:Putative response regulator receiver modulated metal dependent phosphohydrolase n=1 Tax=Magnetococcus massalia (strain MO-1) TaxID=451514 RepID=A0A1S7LFR2_MAGMO|nr:Putative response regulator receiver modulated metal dependent phosphohydrolase [Candidatus Magnetococcus massalia]